ncbi:MAG: hypothetical protein EOP09_14860, partial [Proteobacteria bacterium]
MISKKNSARAFLILALIVAMLLALFVQRRTSRIESTISEIDQIENGTAAEPGLVPTVAPAASDAPWSQKTQQQLSLLSEILASRNDNDPRLDTDLRELTHETKAAFRIKYESLPLESRNERGLIVFLLGRELKDEDDVRFLAKVLQEPSCESFTDCAKSSTASFNRDQEDHHAGQGAALAYPQLVAVKSLDRFLDKKNQPPAGLVNTALE